ncbi:MAG TPA: peptidylprolyl isomerase [Steroidobacteraceae bacterium]|nr:peptidylprolyl isomerase [Steroidobacteraceae bacterium]
MRVLRRVLAAASSRAPALAGLGALLGLALAGVTLLRRIPPAVETVPPGYVALVNGKGILMSDFVAQLMEVDGIAFGEATPQQRAAVLRDMINEEILVQRALVLDLPETTTEVRSVMVSAVNAQAAQPALALQISDAQLRAWYDSHRSAFMSGGSMDVTDLVLRVGGYQNADQSIAQAETDAAEAAYQLRSGADRRYVMDHFGLVRDDNLPAGNQPDFAVKLHLGDQLYAVARTLQDGQVSDPVALPDSVHLLVMDRRIPEQTADFDAVHANVYTEYRDELRRSADEQNLQQLRRDARILLAPGQRE